MTVVGWGRGGCEWTITPPPPPPPPPTPPCACGAVKFTVVHLDTHRHMAPNACIWTVMFGPFGHDTDTTCYYYDAHVAITRIGVSRNAAQSCGPTAAEILPLMRTSLPLPPCSCP